ncbi:hypothetical protein FRB96_001484 [Tulasnella sp. 330]|nr:hypothetical protein FRB96_001484 [Tulasnella sp. 330]KAG8890661.1 hypothetical protein FRB98_006164 [Tulasnella sp. 332]
MPKQHISRLSELPEALAAEIGKCVSRVANALAGALDNAGLNIVCNQEYAQAVPHVHYHIVPAPVLYRSTVLSEAASRPEEASAASQANKAYTSMLKAEFNAREELDDEEGQQLVELIRAKL